MGGAKPPPYLQLGGLQPPPVPTPLLQGHWADRVLPRFYPHFIATGVVKATCRTLVRAPVTVGLEPLSVLGTCPCTAGSEDPGEGHFVEMRDLLGDNIAITQHFESAASYFPTVLPSLEWPHLREVSSLSSWVYCYFDLFSSLGTRPDHSGLPGVRQIDYAGGLLP